jgi:hypothetical protein
MTIVDPRVARLYNLEELLELRRNGLRYARGHFLRDTNAISTGRCRPSRAVQRQCCPLIDRVGTKAGASD